MPITPNRTSLPLGPNSVSGVTALLRRFSNPSTYTGGNALAGMPAIVPTGLIHSQVHEQARDASLYPAYPADTVHQYNVTSRGRNYALITVTSHALKPKDPPLFFFGEAIKGFVILSLADLSDMQSMDVVVCLFPN